MGFPGYDECPGAMMTIASSKFRIPDLSSKDGVALVAVLWIFIFLFVVAFEFSSSVREEGVAAHRYAEGSEGYYLALAGFQEGLHSLLEEPVLRAQVPGMESIPSQPLELVFGSWREGSLGGGFYRVRLVDEGGKVNLNRADENTMRRVFANVGVEESLSDVLVDSILDWRDDDDLHRLNGAEKDYYLALSPPYTARNGPFDTVEDLLWVRGVTPELFYGVEEEGVRRIGLREIFTVEGSLNRINLRTASAEVIHAALGLTLEESRRFVEEREDLSEKTLADLLGLLGIASGDTAMRGFIFTKPSVVTIEAMGYHADPAARRQVRGVVRVVGGNRRFELVRWVDRDTGVSRWREG